jgi:hypothetical protein
MIYLAYYYRPAKGGEGDGENNRPMAATMAKLRETMSKPVPR